ncbi:type 1 glutamine amidotransferase [Clostridium sp. WILCCON 0269]|uniref:Type 1 glutamine amidotransferase n=1 Tax=Candidatus Clostridium eludens TaxID=3381663 RepID=A0ABW8SPZ3_9CLOT
MRIAEFIHDNTHPKLTNLDYWLKDNLNYQTKKIVVNDYTKFSEIKDFDLVILHGGLQHLWNKGQDSWLYREIEYVKWALNNNKPVIGFCLGSQIIAEALGGIVYKAHKEEIGWFRVQLRKEAKRHMLLKDIKENFTSFMCHSDHYKLPENCTSLAFTEAAKHQIFVSNNFPSVGFQFHPEYTLENIKILLKTFNDEACFGEEYMSKKVDLIKQTDVFPSTYGLFKKLMDNSLKWLSIK